MISFQDLVSAGVLATVTDTATVLRGSQYAHEGRVSIVDVARNVGGVVVQSTVVGSGAAVYQTVVAARAEHGRPPDISTACSCPVSHGCKHAVATLVAVAEGAAVDEPAGPASSRWEHKITALIDDLDADGGPATRRSEPRQTELALQVECAVGPPARYTRWGGAAAQRPRLRVRPVSRGTRGRWVKSAFTWEDVARADLAPGGRFRQDHLDLLRELQVAQRAGARLLYSHDSGAERDLHTFGPSLWRLLEEAERTGLPLVGAGLVSDVLISGSPATIGLDLRRGSHGAHLAIGAEVDGVWVGADDVAMIGDPAHGVACWAPDGDDPSAPRTVTLARLGERPSPAVARMLSRAEALDVPSDQVDDLLAEYVPQLRRLVGVGSHDASVRLPELPVPRLLAQVAWEDDATVVLDWCFLYGHGDQERSFVVDESAARRGARDAYAEERLLASIQFDDATSAACLDALSRLTPHRRFRQMDAVDLARTVLPALRAHKDVEVREDGREPEFREARGRPVVEFTTAPSDEDADPRTDWLELSVVVRVEDAQVGLAQVVEALTLGQRRILLHRGVYVSLDHPELDRLARLVEDARSLQEQPRDGLRVPHAQLDMWAELAELGIVDEQAARWTRTATALTGASGVPEVAPPQGLRATLRPYQSDGYHWLAFLSDHGLGGILADDMGLGKTVQMLALVARTREDRTAREAAPFLVVAPTSVVATWAEQAARFTPDLVVRTVTESRSRRGTHLGEVTEGVDILVTSYTLFRLEIEAYRALAWSGLVLDEAQTVKNHRSKTYQCVRRLDAPFTVAVTGTPMENNLMELWSLLSIVAPGMYPHPGRFSEQIAGPIERGDHALLGTLRRRVRPLMLRRTKDQVAPDLPPKQEQVLDVELPARHRAIYDTHLQRERQRILGLVGDLEQHRVTIFQSLTRLRQLSLDPGLVDAEHDAVGSAKIDTLVAHLRELADEGHRALVFSQFTSFLARVRARLEREEMAYSYLDGSTRRRAEVVDGFRSGTQPVFLISLKAGGVGLTLTEADYCFILDPWWNPAVEAQAVDRTHRIGQDDPVMVYRLVSTGTIEEKVMELKARKARLFDSVVGGGELTSSALTADDIAALVS